MTTTTIATWLLTYLIHSTIILVAVLALSRLMGDRRLAVQEGILRTALVGGVLTASVQLGSGISPAVGSIVLDSATATIPGVLADLSLAGGEAAAPSSTVNPVRASGPDWTTILVVFWLVTSVSALLVVLRSVLDLKRLLRTRCFQPAGHLVEKLAAAMGLRRRVKVSTSRAIAVPFATGITQPEICCPERVNELAPEHQRGLYAHELAHLARRDPAWQLLYRLCEAVFALQPLNRLVRRRLEEIAEHLTDERAVAGTGDRLGLARCLVVVAHWGSAAPIGLPATTFAAGPRLDRRVRRLLSGTTDHHVSGGWVVAIAIAFLIGSVSILPAIGATPAHAELNSAAADESSPRGRAPEATEESPEVTARKTWSNAGERPEDDPPPPAEPPVPPLHVSKAPDAVPAPAAVPASKAPPAPEDAPAPEAKPAPAPAPSPATAPAAPNTGSRAPEHPPIPTISPVPAAEPTAPGATAPAARPIAEELERCRNEVSLQDAERARRIAESGGRATRLSQEARRAMELQVRERQAAARQAAESRALSERDRARALADRARVEAREGFVSRERLTEERLEELRRKGLEMQARAELRSREARASAEEHTRVLADEARRLAEQAEAERLALEREKGQR